MKWAGKLASNCPSSAKGEWNWADGIDPESNQASSTGRRRRTVPLHPGSGHLQVIPST
jgi:hypothetical protein